MRKIFILLTLLVATVGFSAQAEGKKVAKVDGLESPAPFNVSERVEGLEYFYTVTAPLTDKNGAEYPEDAEIEYTLTKESGTCSYDWVSYQVLRDNEEVDPSAETQYFDTSSDILRVKVAPGHQATWRIILWGESYTYDLKFKVTAQYGSAEPTEANKLASLRFPNVPSGLESPAPFNVAERVAGTEFFYTVAAPLTDKNGAEYPEDAEIEYTLTKESGTCSYDWVSYQVLRDDEEVDPSAETQYFDTSSDILRVKVAPGHKATWRIILWGESYTYDLKFKVTAQYEDAEPTAASNLASLKYPDVPTPTEIEINVEYVSMPEMNWAVVTVVPTRRDTDVYYSIDGGENIQGYEEPVTITYMESYEDPETGEAVFPFVAFETEHGTTNIVAQATKEIRIAKPVKSEWEEVIDGQFPLPYSYNENEWALLPASDWTVDENGINASANGDYVIGGWVTLQPGVYRIKAKGSDNAKGVSFEISNRKRPAGTSSSTTQTALSTHSFDSAEAAWVYSVEFKIEETSDCRPQIEILRWPADANFNISYIGYEKKAGVQPEPEPEPELVYETVGACTRASREGVALEGKHINVGKEIPVAVLDDNSIVLNGWLGDEDTALRAHYADDMRITEMSAATRSGVAVGQDGVLLAECGQNDFGYVYVLINYGSRTDEAYATSDNTEQTGFFYFQAKFYKDEDNYDEAYYCVAWPIVPVESVAFNTESVELNKGEETNLEELVTVNPENATDNFLTWTSDNEKVATVDENGNVVGVGEGEATITVTCGDKTATIRVKITDPSGIDGVKADALSDNEAAFNVLGQKVTTSHKGLVILRDGRKVIRK